VGFDIIKSNLWYGQISVRTWLNVSFMPYKRRVWYR